MADKDYILEVDNLKKYFPIKRRFSRGSKRFREGRGWCFI